MTLQEAINTLSAMQENYEGDEFPNEERALKLGIAALKEYQKLKLTTFLPIGYKLPGETP